MDGRRHEERLEDRVSSEVTTCHECGAGKLVVRAAMILLVVALSGSTAAAEQPDMQIWGEIMLDWIKSHSITLKLDIEPKVLVSKPSDDPGWATLDVTPSIEYSRGNWFDIVGELLVARTRQTDDLDSTEITPRIGFRFHVLSNLF